MPPQCALIVTKEGHLRIQVVAPVALGFQLAARRSVSTLYAPTTPSRPDFRVRNFELVGSRRAEPRLFVER